MAYYSTQARIEAKASASRVLLFGDKDRDGSIDSASLSQALTAAVNLIKSYTIKRFGKATVDAWDSSTVPGLLQDISDTITLFYLASGSNQLNPVVKLLYDEAKEMLCQIRDGELDLSEVSVSSTTFAPVGVSTAEDLDECRVFHRSADETTTGTTSEVSDLVTQLIRQGVAVSVSPTTAIEATDTIEYTYHVMKIYGVVSGSPTNVTMTSTPTIAAGDQGGRILVLQGANDSATVTLQDNSVLSGSLLRLQYGRDFTLGNNDQIEFRWDAGAGLWLEQGRVDLF